MNSPSFPPPQTVWLHFNSGLLGKNKQKKPSMNGYLLQLSKNSKSSYQKSVSWNKDTLMHIFSFDAAEDMQDIGDLD